MIFANNRMRGLRRFLRGFVAWTLGLAVLIGLVATLVIINQKPILEDAAFIGSGACGV